MVKNLVRKYWAIFLIAAVIVLLDQWTKELVRDNIPQGSTWLPESLLWLSPYARIVHWYNTGAAFGMFKDASTILTVLAFIVIGAILFYYPQVNREDWSLRLALSMQLGGALGNLVDRLTIGHVTDFISVGNFPVFNIADASISVGAAVLFIGVWLQERAERKRRDSNTSVEITGETTSE
jgi:signal peptidase II